MQVRALSSAPDRIINTWVDMMEEKKKAKRKPRRSRSQLLRDRRRISDLYLEGWLQVDIAQEVGLAQSTVSLDLKALHKEWLKSALVNTDQTKSKELARIDRLEREYYAAWRRSCEDAETITQKTKGVIQRKQDKEGVFVSERPGEATKTSKGQAGDPRFLSGVQWCIDRRCKILGIDAEVKVKHTGEAILVLTGNVGAEDF